MDTRHDPIHIAFGIHPVMEAIDSGRELEKVFIRKGMRSEAVTGIRQRLREQGIPCQDVPQEKLNRLTRKNHQGIVAVLCPIEYSRIGEVVQRAFEKGEQPLILVLDRVSDVGNFGAICRSAECAGVHGILIPTKGSAQVNSFAVKSSAGAIFNIDICRTAHLPAEVRKLKESGLRILACTEKAKDDLFGAGLSGPVVLIIGSEEDGIGDGLMGIADEVIGIPMAGNTGSLNVSVATGIVLFERLRQVRNG